MTTFIKKQKEDCANSSLSISTITTAGNLLPTSSSNTNLTNANNAVPKTQINLFNQSQKQNNKQGRRCRPCFAQSNYYQAFSPGRVYPVSSGRRER